MAYISRIFISFRTLVLTTITVAFCCASSLSALAQTGSVLPIFPVEGALQPPANTASLLQESPAPGDVRILGMMPPAFSSTALSGEPTPIVAKVSAGSHTVELAINGVIQPTSAVADGYQTQAVLAAGTHYVQLVIDSKAVSTTPITVANIAAKRIAGSTRTETAIGVADALRQIHGTPNHVLIVNENALADAIAATPLAHSLKAPMLVSAPDNLTPATSAWLAANRQATPIIIGGSQAISDEVFHQIATINGNAVERIAGPTRYETAIAISEQVRLHSAALNGVVLVNSNDWHTALPACAWAAAHDMAIVYGEGNGLPPATTTWLRANEKLAANVVGISDPVIANIDSAAIANPGRAANEAEIVLTKRFASTASPESLALELAKDTSPTNLVVIAPTSSIDALVAGPLAAQFGPMVFAHDVTRQMLTVELANKKPSDPNTPAGNLIFIGGTKVIANATIANILAAEQDVNQTQSSGFSLTGEGIHMTSATPARVLAMQVVDGETVIPGVVLSGSNKLVWKFTNTYRERAKLVGHNLEVYYLVQYENGEIVHGATTLLVPQRQEPKLDKNGFSIAPGQSEIIGHEGKLFTFTVGVLPGVGQDALSFSDDVQDILFHAKGWTAQGKYRLQRIDDPEQANIQVVLASPKVVDAFCARAGLRTGGKVSCWNDHQTMINVNRWFTGVPHIPNLETYRNYLINHEFGHGLDNRHAYCPRRGAFAPVMQQQTHSLQGCIANGYPYP